MSPPDPEVARTYYRCLDDGDYDTLEGLYAPEVAHYRPDRTFQGRDTLISFMREGRPRTDTTHEVSAVYETADAPEVAVRGRLLDADGAPIFSFVDVFEFDDEGSIRAIYTHTR